MPNYGVLASCNGNSFVKECFPCKPACRHVDDILDTYGSGIYSSDTILYKIITILLKQQALFLDALCDASIPLKQIAQLMGLKSCEYDLKDNGCLTVCGGNYRQWINTECHYCKNYIHSDDTYIKIFQIIPYLNEPIRSNIEAICTIFNWDVVYTTDYINIIIYNDDPNIYKSVIDLIPIPLGVDVRILTNC